MSFRETDGSEYAGNRLQEGEEKIGTVTMRGADRLGRWGTQRTYANIKRWHNRPPKLKVPKSKRLPAPKRTALPSAKQTAKTAQRATRTAKAAAKATVQAVKVAAKAIVAAVKATIAVVKDVIAAIAAGGWVAVVIILLICVIGGAVAGIAGIFGVDESGYSISYLLSSCKNESAIYEQQIIESIPHDTLVISGDEPSVKDIVAVYAAKTSATGKDFAMADETLQAEFRHVYDVMYSAHYYTTTRIETVQKEYLAEDGTPYFVNEQVTKTVLHICWSMMPADEAADYFSFKKKQREYLNTLLSQDFDEMWAELVD